MLSWKSGIPIARVQGGEFNLRILYVNNDPTSVEKVIQSNIPYIITEKWLKSKKRQISHTEINRLYKCLSRGTPPDDDVLNIIYNEAKKILQSSGETEIILTSGKLVPLPEKENTTEKNLSRRKSSRLYIAGPSESGKSTFASNYIKEILNKHKDKKKIYLFSVLTQDETLDKLGPIRIKLDDGLVDDPIKLDELKSAIVIFDDVETILDAKVKKAVQNLRDTCISEGRHHNISSICTNHAICDYKSTAKMLLEAKLCVFFPQAGGISGIKRFLTTYCGLEKQMIQKIMTLPSRWVAIHKAFPMYCMYESGCFLLNPPLMADKNIGSYNDDDKVYLHARRKKEEYISDDEDYYSE